METIIQGDGERCQPSSRTGTQLPQELHKWWPPRAGWQLQKETGNNPATTLGNLWRELERRFGNTAALTQALIERLCSAAHFGEKDNVKLQKLADLCADIDCQTTHLPGLACLNFPVRIGPIV